jgi:hypothetical protein
MLEFVEPRQAPLPVRTAFEAWPAVVAMVILGYWFATPTIT